MNKISKILILLSLTLFIIGCSDDDNKDIQKLKVIKSDTEYASLGGTGTIDLDAIETVIATSSQNWCKPTVSGNKITLAVEQNTNINGRHAVITIKSGDEATAVTITQLGTTFLVDKTNLRLAIAGDEGKIVFKSENPVTVNIKPTDGWLSYTIDNDTIIIKALKAQNKRYTKIELVSGILKKEVSIDQEMLSYADLLGMWTMAYEDIDDLNQTANIELAVYQQGISYILKGLPPFNAQCLIYFNAPTEQIYITPGLRLGSYQGYQLYTTITDPDQSKFTTSATVQYMGTIDQSVTAALTYKFADNGTWPGFKANGISIAAYDKTIESGGTYKGDFERLKYWVLTKQ